MCFTTHVTAASMLLLFILRSFFFNNSDSFLKPSASDVCSYLSCLLPGFIHNTVGLFLDLQDFCNKMVAHNYNSSAHRRDAKNAKKNDTTRWFNRLRLNLNI